MDGTDLNSLLRHLFLRHVVQTCMFTAGALVFDQRQLDRDFKGSSQVQFLPPSANDLQAVLGSNLAFRSCHRKSSYLRDGMKD